jgi:hypothetical protein
MYMWNPKAGFDKIMIDATEFLEGKSSLKISASDKDILIISEPFKVRRYGGYYSRIRARSDSKPAPDPTADDHL